MSSFQNFRLMRLAGAANPFQSIANVIQFGGNDAPPPPDYAAAARQTAAGNKETAISTQAGNMINQYTPQGSVTYAQRGTYDGTPLWEQVVTLSPEQQRAYQKDVAMNARLQDVGMQGVGYVQNALNAPLQSPGQAAGTAGTTNFVSNVNAPWLNTAGGNLGGMQRGIAEPTIGLATGAYGGQMQMGVNNYSNVQSGIQGAGGINQGVYQNLGDVTTSTGANERAGTFNYNPQAQTGIGYSGEIQSGLAQPAIGVTGSVANAGSLAYGSPQNASQIRTNVQDPNLVQQQVTDALYKQQTAMLDPQFAKSQKGLENQLSNQGITRGSEAWNNAMQEASMQKQQAYESARSSAIGQGVNAAQGLYASQLAGMNAANQALGQQFSQGLQGAQFANTAQQQAYQQSLSNAQMQNQARAQQLQEALSKGEFTNQAQAQAYAQELQNIQQQNAAATQLFGMQQANANLANQAANQQYAQQLSNAQLYNQALQQNFANAQTLRQEPINILNAVRTGSQMQTAAQPQVGVSQPGQLANYSGPDYLGAATATGQYNQGLYNAQQASNSAMTSGLMGLAGAGIMGAGMYYGKSDRRTKENIIKIGKLDNGLNLYTFEYKDEFKDEAGHGKQIGVMADEVEAIMPEAVKIGLDGYKMVDYGVIYG